MPECCKKISVCHGPTCGSEGGPAIKKTLKNALGETVVIEETECCGRCEEYCSIIVDDELTICNLSPETIQEKFLASPGEAIERARAEQDESQKKLDALFQSELLS